MCRPLPQYNRFGQPPLRTEPKIVLFGKRGDAVFCKKLTRDPFCRPFVGQSLGTALAKLGQCAFFVGVGPRTRLAIDAAFLIERQQSTGAANDAHFAIGVGNRVFNRFETRGGLERRGYAQIAQLFG